MLQTTFGSYFQAEIIKYGFLLCEVNCERSGWENFFPLPMGLKVDLIRHLINNHYCLFYWKILFIFERLEDKIKDIWKILQAFPIGNHSHLEISQFMTGINGHSLIIRGTYTWPTIVSVSIYWEGNCNWEKPDLSFCQEKK